MAIKTRRRFVSRAISILGSSLILSCVLIIHYNQLTRTILQRVDVYLTVSADLEANERIPPSRHQQAMQQQQDPSSSRFAYAFLLTECDPEYPQQYHGSLYSILVNAQILESTGSEADIVIMVRMSHLTNATTLPNEDIMHINAYPRVILHYLSVPTPTSKPPTLHQLQMEKFRILELTQYRRVIYLDPTIMLLCSLDYLFEWSEQEDTTLQDNIILAGNNEPAKTSFMMLRPGVGEYQLLQREIDRQTTELWSNQFTWNETVGWGHVITPPDHWRSRYDVKHDTKWNFPLAYTDQGLLYYWTKYVKKSVSIFMGNEVEHWSSSPLQTDDSLQQPTLLATLKDIIKGYECPSRLEFPYDRHTKPPYDLEGQMWHFWKEPPWMIQDWNPFLRAANNSIHKPYQKWLRTIMDVERRLQIRLDLKHLRPDNAPSNPWVSMKDVQKSLERQHAYVFLLAGCDPSRPRDYRGVMYSILVAAQVLESSGSKADIVVMVQMSDKSESNELPDDDLSMLYAYPSIVVHYLPKPTESITFYELLLLKFHMLELTAYRRVMYLDADVIPLCNLDYLFHLSEIGMLKENVILASKLAPATGHFIMLQPGVGEYDQLVQTVQRRDENILTLAQNRTFDEVNGWGHAIQSPDRWKARLRSGRRWSFPSAFADQGLLYHWVKYVKKSASIFIGKDIEHWSPFNESYPVKENSRQALKEFECKSRMVTKGNAIERHIWHFSQDRPWEMRKESSQVKSPPYQMWLRVLGQVKRRLKMPKISKNEFQQVPLWRSQTLRTDFTKHLERMYAYAFLIADCDPAHPQGYRGLLLGIMVNAQILQEAGSTADVVVMVQMSHRSESHVLHPDDIVRLNEFPRVVIHYLPKAREPLTFYEVQLEKMHVLELTRYRRVIFLDADVMPLCNLDYLFHLSEKGTLKENIVIAGNNEPANGGILMLRPAVGEFEQIQKIIDCRDAHIINFVPGLTFDAVFGWGRPIPPADRWRSRVTSGAFWNFSAGYGDQGLIYHWVKYVKKSASLFIRNEVEHWSGPNNTDIPALEATVVDPLKGYECPTASRFSSLGLDRSLYGLEGQIWHFYGNVKKPWVVQDPRTLNHTSSAPAYRMWFRALAQVQRRLKVKLDAKEDFQFMSNMKHWTDKEDFKAVMEKKRVREGTADCLSNN